MDPRHSCDVDVTEAFIPSKPRSPRDLRLGTSPSSPSEQRTTFRRDAARDSGHTLGQLPGPPRRAGQYWRAQRFTVRACAGVEPYVLRLHGAGAAGAGHLCLPSSEPTSGRLLDATFLPCHALVRALMRSRQPAYLRLHSSYSTHLFHDGSEWWVPGWRERSGRGVRCADRSPHEQVPAQLDRSQGTSQLAPARTRRPRHGRAQPAGRGASFVDIRTHRVSLGQAGARPRTRRSACRARQRSTPECGGCWVCAAPSGGIAVGRRGRCDRAGRVTPCAGNRLSAHTAALRDLIAALTLGTRRDRREGDAGRREEGGGGGGSIQSHLTVRHTTVTSHPQRLEAWVCSRTSTPRFAATTLYTCRLPFLTTHFRFSWQANSSRLPRTRSRCHMSQSLRLQRAST